LTKEDQPFSWGVEVDNAFQSLKAFFMIALPLIHEDPSTPFVLEMDAFNFVVSVVLSQLGDDNVLHLVGFHSRMFSRVEINYKIHDKKLLGNVDDFEE
jgi:hypothetical protein